MLIGTVIVTAWRLLIYEPGGATSGTWLSLIVGLLIFLAVGGGPIAVGLLAALLLIADRRRLGRLAIVASSIVAGALFTAFVVGSWEQIATQPLVPIVHLLPWALFGLFIRLDSSPAGEAPAAT